MTPALTKVETPLSERYETKCVKCGWLRHFFGTEKEARESALKMGWEFRVRFQPLAVQRTDYVGSGPSEVAYCPHCRLLFTGEQ